MLLIRHGQSEFNAAFSETRVDPGIPDPGLTAEGRRQAAQVAAGLRETAIRRLITSPYTRALETATIIADALGLAVGVEPLIRERAAFICDIGASPAELKRRFPRFDFGHLADPWWHDQLAAGAPESEAALIARCQAFRVQMAGAADLPRVGVITHWGFIRALTGRPVPNGEIVPFDPTA
ncbi:MAG: histidine phosphatase family protein [Pseudomonadota bacterium]